MLLAWKHDDKFVVLFVFFGWIAINSHVALGNIGRTTWRRNSSAVDMLMLIYTYFIYMLKCWSQRSQLADLIVFICHESEYGLMSVKVSISFSQDLNRHLHQDLHSFVYSCVLVTIWHNETLMALGVLPLLGISGLKNVICTITRSGGQGSKVWLKKHTGKPCIYFCIVFGVINCMWSWEDNLCYICACGTNIFLVRWWSFSLYFFLS